MPPFRRKPFKPKRKRRYYRKGKSLEQKIKQITLKQCETKMSPGFEENIQLVHNTTVYKYGHLVTQQGVTDPGGFGVDTLRNRVGDQVIARGIKYKWWISNKLDRPNVMYFLYVFSYNPKTTPTDSTFWRGTNGTGGVMNRMIDSPNGERVSVLKRINITPGYTSNFSTQDTQKEKSFYKEFYVNLKNRKITYEGDNAQLPKGKDIGFAIVAYDAYGTIPPSNGLASFAFSKTFYFKDP